MKRPLSMVRETTPYAIPPRVLVMAESGHTGAAITLAETLDQIGAEAEVQFGEVADRGPDRSSRAHLDAVIVAGTRGYRIARHHPILDHVRNLFAPRDRG